MTIRNARMTVALGLCLGLNRGATADEPTPGAKPVPVPVTRQDMKQALEDSKRATPRLPLPAPTAAEKAHAEEAAKARAEEAAKAGVTDRAGQAMGGIINNGRMRTLYLSDYGTNRPAGAGAGTRAGQGGPGRDADSTLGYPFQTMLFWIVSRGNNCIYCMGHQEVKLASAGLTDDQIAALDGDWSEFDDAKRAAFGFAKKLTYEPNAITDADIAGLRKHYNNAQVVEIIQSVAGFNATNRWTGSLRIPQEDHRDFLRPTSEKYADVSSLVAPVGREAKGCVAPTPRTRPALESRAEVEAALDAARKRSPRVDLADESATKAALNSPDGDAPPQWVRLAAVFPKTVAGRVAAHEAAQTKGTLAPKTRATIAWVAARNDRAWYALGHAQARLKALGFTDGQIFALDDADAIASAADREVVRFARKLTLDPALIVDDDVARLRKLFDDRTVAEIVNQVCVAASFDRLTEAAGLRLEK